MRHLLGYLALRLGAGLVGLLSGRLARRLGRVAGRAWRLSAPGRRAMARRHMRRVLGDDSAAASAAGAVFASYGRYYAEALWIRRRRIDEVLAGTRVDGLDMIIAARDQGRGMIYALPHMGNWEVAAPVAVREGVHPVAVAENLANRRITDWFTAMRGEMGIEIVLATGSAEVMRKLEAALGENKAVALLADRDLKGRGVTVTFFGEETTLPAGPATLALRTGAPLFPVVTYFDGDDGYHVVVRPPIPVPEGGTRGERVAAVTQRLAEHMEGFIRAAPEQWHLVQPNWPSDRA